MRSALADPAGVHVVDQIIHAGVCMMMQSVHLPSLNLPTGYHMRKGASAMNRKIFCKIIMSAES